MTSTFLDLINETAITLSGYTATQDQATSLTNSMAAGDLTFVTNGSIQVSRGLVEIDDELIWVDSWSPLTNTAVVPAYGRGMRGTTAASHSAGARITLAPTFPRFEIERNLNAAIDAVYPDLYGIGTTTFSFSPAVNTYSIPADVINVISVAWQTVGPTKEWIPIKDYRLDLTADPTTWTTGKTITLYSPIVAGRTVSIRYTNKPPTLVNLTDIFETTTGLPTSCREVVILGAAYRVAAFLDLGRISAVAAEAAAVGGQGANPVGTGANLSRILKQMYQDRLLTEVRRQQQQFPPRIHRTR